MEQNRIVIMLDEEIARLQQIRTIMQSLAGEEVDTDQLLQAAAAEPEPEQAHPQSEPETVRPVPEPRRYVSRRGMSTGRRGPRPGKRATTTTPRPLDGSVPKAPVVVPRSALPVVKAAVVPSPSALEGTLEAWVRSLKQAAPAA